MFLSKKLLNMKHTILSEVNFFYKSFVYFFVLIDCK